VQPVRYRKPSAINAVSITLALVLLGGGYAAYEYGRAYVLRQEAYRVLEETSSHFAGRRALYAKDGRERDRLRDEMTNNLRGIGIDDPQIETWIEVDPDAVRFGVVYTARYRWPFDAMPPIERDVEIEHIVADEQP
jgi:hypothetical protein